MMKHVPWCTTCTGNECVSNEPYILIAMQFGKAMAAIFTKHFNVLDVPGTGEA